MWQICHISVSEGRVAHYPHGLKCPPSRDQPDVGQPDPSSRLSQSVRLGQVEDERSNLPHLHVCATVAEGRVAVRCPARPKSGPAGVRSTTLGLGQGDEVASRTSKSHRSYLTELQPRSQHRAGTCNRSSSVRPTLNARSGGDGCVLASAVLSHK